MDPNNEINIERKRNKVKKIRYNNVDISYLATCKFTFVPQILECYKSIIIENKNKYRTLMKFL